MAPHTITPAVGAVYSCKAKAGLRRSPQGLHTHEHDCHHLRLNLDSSLKDDLVPFRCSPVFSCAAPLQTEVSMSGRQGQHT
ncbi:hypothetical protein TNCV_1628701 [Trichonephila clavipes]|nr:hypothetical protein TNCV_1628701 [Trichonephila clavipes]